jgi:hypothetical protein
VAAESQDRTVFRIALTRLDNLKSDAAFDGLLLFGHPDASHAALAELLQQLVRADDLAISGRDGPAVFVSLVHRSATAVGVLEDGGRAQRRWSLGHSSI